MAQGKRSTTVTPRDTCPICKEEYSSLYLRTHLVKEHGISGGLTGVVRRKQDEPDEEFQARLASVMTAKKKKSGRSRKSQELVSTADEDWAGSAGIPASPKVLRVNSHGDGVLVLRQAPNLTVVVDEQTGRIGILEWIHG